MKRPTAWCDRCKATVYTDAVHSYYDAVERLRQCERVVVEEVKFFIEITMKNMLFTIISNQNEDTIN